VATAASTIMVSMDAQTVVAELTVLADPTRAEHSARFFKTGPGQYGEGDVFLGLTVPKTRIVAKRYRDLPRADVEELLSSPMHEVRLCGVVIITEQFKKLKTTPARIDAFDYYVGAVRAGYINNWDLIDVSAPTFGTLLVDQGRIASSNASGERLLFKLADADSMWERRLAVLLTFAFIRANQFELTLTLATKLLDDKQDLMHKAVGWMLREVGKRDADVLRAFLAEHIRELPRTSLRYAIEKFDEAERKAWLAR
jgi:3-methyladenine DNA glycosylase AlkD